MKRLAVLLLATGLVAAACSSDSGTEPSPTASSPEPSASPSTSPSPTGSGATIDLEIWFTRDGRLFPTRRTIPDTPAVGTAAIEALLAGPNEQERAAGVSSAVEPGTRLVEPLDIEPGFAVVTLSSHAESDPLSDAQLVYTLTQFPTIENVIINDQEGGPLTREALQNQLPAIVVLSQVIGESVPNPVTVSGTADVFEAVVHIRIKDQTGAVIADEVTMASCGSGCRGTYSAEVDYDVDTDQPGTILVFEVSEENGKPIKPVVDIPVTLTA